MCIFLPALASKTIPYPNFCVKKYGCFHQAVGCMYLLLTKLICIFHPTRKLFVYLIRVCLLEVSSYPGHSQRSWHIHSSDTQRIWLWNYSSPTRPNVEIIRLGSSQNHKEHGDRCHIQGKVSGVFVASHPLHISPLSQTRAPSMKVITTTYSTILLRKNKSQYNVQGLRETIRTL